MGFWGWAIAIGIAGHLINKANQNSIEAAEEKAEQERRKKTPCRFIDGFSEDEFEQMVRKASKRIRRISEVSVDGPFIHCAVQSQTGISEWEFELDFNDYGHITGTFWCSSDNSDSNIPNRLGELIRDEINKCLSEKIRKHASWVNPAYEEDGQTLDEYAEENLIKTKQQIRTKKQLEFKSIVKRFFITVAVIGLVALIACVGLKYWEKQKEIEVGISSAEVAGSNYVLVQKKLERAGFTNIYLVESKDLNVEEKDKEQNVSAVSIDGCVSFEENDRFPYDAEVKITYHLLKEKCAPITAKEAKKMDYQDVGKVFSNSGFTNISFEEQTDLITGWITKDGSVESVTINGESDYTENTPYRLDAEVVITYHTFPE